MGKIFNFKASLCLISLLFISGCSAYGGIGAGGSTAWTSTASEKDKKRFLTDHFSQRRNTNVSILKAWNTCDKDPAIEKAMAHAANNAAPSKAEIQRNIDSQYEAWSLHARTKRLGQYWQGTKPYERRTYHTALATSAMTGITSGIRSGRAKARARYLAMKKCMFFLGYVCNKTKTNFCRLR